MPDQPDNQTSAGGARTAATRHRTAKAWAGLPSAAERMAALQSLVHEELKAKRGTKQHQWHAPVEKKNVGFRGPRKAYGPRIK